MPGVLHRVCHPYVIAEQALVGTPKAGRGALGLLEGLPVLPVALVDEVRVLIEARRLPGSGIRFVDAGIITSYLPA